MSVLDYSQYWSVWIGGGGDLPLPTNQLNSKIILSHTSDEWSAWIDGRTERNISKQSVSQNVRRIKQGLCWLKTLQNNDNNPIKY